jgi:hypothetical protein
MTHFIIEIDIEMENEVYESPDVQFFIKEMSMPRFSKMLKDSYKATVLGAQSEKITITYGIKQHGK